MHDSALLSMEKKESSILSGDYHNDKGKKINVSLTDATVFISYDTSEDQLNFEDIVGVEKKGTSLTIHHYPLIENNSCCNKGQKRVYFPTTIEFKDVETVQLWELRMTQILRDAPFDDKMPKSDSIVVLINPASGSGKAEQIWNQVESIFKHSGHHYDVIITERQYHAKELMKTKIHEYSCVTIVSGDGLVTEVVNGLMSRPDWATIIENVRIGHIGGGSGNGLYSSICHVSDEPIDQGSAALLIVKGVKRKMDMIVGVQEDEPPFFGFLSIEWAIASDMDLESEVYRCCGPERFTCAAIVRLCCLRIYQGSLSFIPERTSDGKHIKSWSGSDEKCSSACDICLAGSKNTHTEISRLKKFLDRVGFHKNESDKNEEKKRDKEDDLASENWEHVDGDISMVWGMNVTHAATDAIVAPYAHLSDGCMDLLYVNRVGRPKLTQILLSFEEGTHVNVEGLQYLKAKAVRLNPCPDFRKYEKDCVSAFDGERMPFKPFELRMFQSIFTVCARPYVRDTLRNTA